MGLESDRVKIVRDQRRVEFTIFKDDQIILLSDRIDFLSPFQA